MPNTVLCSYECVDENNPEQGATCMYLLRIRLNKAAPWNTSAPTSCAILPYYIYRCEYEYELLAASITRCFPRPCLQIVARNVIRNMLEPICLLPGPLLPNRVAVTGTRTSHPAPLRRRANSISQELPFAQHSISCVVLRKS